MLTIISGTNRKDSMTHKVSNITLQLAKAAGIESQLLDLASLPSDFIHSGQYAPSLLPTWLIELQDQYFIKANNFIFISPEYNGSFPGYLKLFIDAISVHKLKESLVGKRSALVGVASGRAGNLRGMDHLSGVLNHIGCHVIPGNLPLSKIGSLFNEAGDMTDDTKLLISSLISKLMSA